LGLLLPKILLASNREQRTQKQFLLKGQKPLDFVGSLGVATRRVNQQPKIAGIDRLEEEKLKGQFSYERMMYRFPSFRHVEHIMTGP
jgi:hypothetical protein